MNLRWAFSVLIVFHLILFDRALGNENLPKLVKEIQPAIVTVKTYDPNNRLIGVGSGFFLNKKGHLITNRHVLVNAHTSEVVTSDGKHYPILRVLDANQYSDLIKVVVDIPENEIQWLKVTKDLPSPAEHVIVIGSPRGLSQTISDGIVSFVPKQTACEMPLTVNNSIQITAPISQGSSGSPVVNMKGEVIGVATFMFVKGQNLNFAAPGKCVLNLSEEKIDKPLSKWTYATKKEILSRAEQLSKNKKHEMAIAAYKEIIKSNPNLAEAHYGIGKVYSTLVYYKEWLPKQKRTVYINSLDIEEMKYRAIGAFKEAIRINPDFAEAHYKLGLIYYQLFRIPETVSHLKIAIALKPDYAAAYGHLGLVYANMGDIRLARKQLMVLKKLEKSRAGTEDIRAAESASVYAELFILEFSIDRAEERKRKEHETFKRNKQRTDDGVRIYKDKNGTIVITD